MTVLGLINSIAYVDTKIKGILHCSKMCKNPFKGTQILLVFINTF